jgi:hypothetical protein
MPIAAAIERMNGCEMLSLVLLAAIFLTRLNALQCGFR